MSSDPANFLVAIRRGMARGGTDLVKAIEAEKPSDGMRAAIIARLEGAVPKDAFQAGVRLDQYIDYCDHAQTLALIDRARVVHGSPNGCEGCVHLTQYNWCREYEAGAKGPCDAFEPDKIDDIDQPKGTLKCRA